MITISFRFIHITREMRWKKASWSLGREKFNATGTTICTGLTRSHWLSHLYTISHRATISREARHELIFVDIYHFSGSHRLVHIRLTRSADCHTAASRQDNTQKNEQHYSLLVCWKVLLKIWLRGWCDDCVCWQQLLKFRWESIEWNCNRHMRKMCDFA